MSLAIVIPFYKIEFFKECLESLAAQTNKNFHIYIGDDASPDDPKPIIEEFEKSLNITYKRFKNNLGRSSLVKQWNRCIALSKEDWLMILGDDDYLGADLIENWYMQFNSFINKSNIIRFATISVDENTRVISKKYEHPIWESAADSYYRRFLEQTRSSLSEYIFCRQSYQKYGFHDFPLAWFSDNRAWLDFSDNKPIYTINSGIAFIRTSKFNISGRIDNIDLKNKALLQFYDYLILKKLKLFTKEQRLKLLRYYEDRLNNNKELTLIKKAVLTFYYLNNYNHKIFVKFMKRIFRNSFK